LFLINNIKLILFYTWFSSITMIIKPIIFWILILFSSTKILSRVNSFYGIKKNRLFIGSSFSHVLSVVLEIMNNFALETPAQEWVSIVFRSRIVLSPEISRVSELTCNGTDYLVSSAEHVHVCCAPTLLFQRSGKETHGVIVNARNIFRRTFR